MEDLALELFGELSADGSPLPLLPIAIETTPEKPKAPAKLPPEPAPVAKPSASTELALLTPAKRKAEGSSSSTSPPAKRGREEEETALALLEEDQQEGVPSGAYEGTLNYGRWKELAKMGLTCVALEDWTEVCHIMPDLGHDFYLGFMNCERLGEVADRLVGLSVGGHSAVGTFTHCFLARTEDGQADINSVIDEFGLGLRKRKAIEAGEQGHVYLLAVSSGRSAVAKTRARLAPDDKKLSREERCRRSHIEFELSNTKAIATEARRNQGSFLLTSFANVDYEACKKCVISFSLKGKAMQAFQRCLIMPVPDCRKATQQMEHQAGQGCRRTKVKSANAPGCLVMFLPAKRAAPGPLVPAAGSASSVPTPSRSAPRQLALAN